MALLLVWACSPTTLFQKSSKMEEGAAVGAAIFVPDSVPAADEPTAEEPTSRWSVRPLTDTTTVDTMITIDAGNVHAQQGEASPADSTGAAASPSGGRLEGALPDSLPPPTGEGRAALKRDTTTMDSLELAIYKYNKVIDDSLALDSLNRRRKNGIDAPVEFSAKDSLIYIASSGVAHLFGDSHV